MNVRPGHKPLALLLAAFLLAGLIPLDLAAAPPPAAKDDSSPDVRLRQLEQEMKRREAEREEIRKTAERLSAELSKINRDMVAAAKAVQEHEETLSELESRTAELTATESRKMDDLLLKRQQMNGVLIALERLAARPSEALIAQPTSPADTVRSAILLREVLPRITEQAKQLKEEIDQVAALRASIAQQRKRILTLGAKLDAEHRRLAALYERKRQVRTDAEEKQVQTEKRLSAMAGEAKDLKELMARLEEEAKARARQEAAEAKARARQEEEERAKAAALAARNLAPPPTAKPPAPLPEKRTMASFQAGRGKMPFPARGQVIARFNEKTDSLTSRGITIETRSDAQVVAPYDGHIVFAGPFRGYGLLLIIEHSEGYHTLLSGLSRIDGAAGQNLVAGEPVGVMGRTDNKPNLYFELRHNGQPVDPLPWLTVRNTRVSG